jgi:amino acid transporter
MNEPTYEEAEHRRRGVPQGYRQGLITAITVLLGFTLAFLRYWGFEAPGEWTKQSIVATVALGIAVLLQIIALVRSWRLEDDHTREYRKTVLYLTWSTALLVLGLVVAAIVFAD